MEDNDILKRLGLGQGLLEWDEIIDGWLDTGSPTANYMYKPKWIFSSNNGIIRLSRVR